MLVFALVSAYVPGAFAFARYQWTRWGSEYWNREDAILDVIVRMRRCPAPSAGQPNKMVDGAAGEKEGTS